MPPINELVVYELHPATFAGTLDDVAAKLEHLVDLGVNCVELMPVAEFAGDVSWGYNPAQRSTPATDHSDARSDHQRRAH